MPVSLGAPPARVIHGADKGSSPTRLGPVLRLDAGTRIQQDLLAGASRRTAARSDRRSCSRTPAPWAIPSSWSATSPWSAGRRASGQKREHGRAFGVLDG